MFRMESKGGRSAAVVTAETVKKALSKTTDLTATEEKVLRMRHGASAGDPRAPLPQAHGGREELKDELLLLELQLLRAYRAHRSTKETARNRAIPAAGQKVDAKAKDKIVRALRKKNK
jgi:hypothetical protein